MGGFEEVVERAMWMWICRLIERAREGDAAQLTGECRPSEATKSSAAARLGEESSDGDGRAEQSSWLAGCLSPLPCSLSCLSGACVFLCWIERASERAERICASVCVFWLQLDTASNQRLRACCSLSAFSELFSISPIAAVSQSARQPSQPSQSSRDLISSQHCTRDFRTAFFSRSLARSRREGDLFCSNGRALRSSQPDKAKNSSRFPHSHSWPLEASPSPHCTCLTQIPSSMHRRTLSDI